MQIRKKMPIILNVLICVPLAVLTLVIYIYSTNNSIMKSENGIRLLAVSEGRALSALIESNMHQVQMIANDKRIITYIKNSQDNHEKLAVEKYLNNELMASNEYDIVLIDKNGEVCFPTIDQERNIKLSYAENFEEVLQGKRSFKEMVLVDGDRGNAINMTVPIWDDQSKVIGAVCKVMSAKDFDEFAQSIQIEQTGYAFIINEQFELVVHPNKNIEGKVLPQEELRREIASQVDKGNTKGEYHYSYEGQVKYTAYSIIPEIGWVICITQNISEMQRQALVGSFFVVVTLFILIFVANMMSKQLIKGIIGPIDQLIETMNNVSAGELTTYCKYDGDDELGMLSKNYNQMLSKLGESHMHLNEVYKELAETKKELEYNYSALEKSQEALEKCEERYKVTLDAIDEVIWEYHVESKHFYATDNWNKIIGYDLAGCHINELIERHLEPQVADNMMGNIRRCLSGETKDFTQELWMTKNHERSCLLCKGHAITNDAGQVEKMIGILTDITYNKQNEETVRKLTYFDGLTGCLNKSTFIESLDAWLESGNVIKEGALLFIDLDDFKKINDVLSHEIGDRVLHYVGKQLTDILPQDAFIGRFGGDEFVIFKSFVERMEEVHELVYAILSLFQNHIRIEQMKIHLTCSIGIAMYPTDGEDSAMLLKNADTAMYKVKDTGKNSYGFYTKAMSQTLDRKLLIEEALREAIAKNSFYLQYQPVVDLRDNRTKGCEALVRLYDSDLGYISPGEFIPVAEETILIIQAGDWILENALKELKRLQDKGFNEFTMNINISAMQIREEHFMNKLVSVIKKIGVLPQSIKLEVTESVLMENIEKSIELFYKVKALGIRIALDDFGTGYSSLNYLRSIPLDILKIDKSFIDEITTSKVLSEIVDSIINMAHALDIQVVAEGVENEMQLEVLKKKGCDMIQGYYYSKPLSGKDLEQRLTKEALMAAEG